MKHLSTPVSADVIRGLQVGDEVAISGVIVTARDAAHQYLVEQDAAELRAVLKGTFIYHCGPVIAGGPGNYRMVAAGPTTSSREEPYQAAVLEKFGVRGVIGKGGMGPQTLKGLHDFGAVYLHAIGGAAVVLADTIKKVDGVYKLEEFGVPEALWVLQVENFPAVVTMDSHGGSLHQQVKAESDRVLAVLLDEISRERK